MSESIAEISKYYTDMHLMFKTAGEHLHHGIWEKDTKTLKEANDNSNRFVAEQLELGPSDAVLDAGCGYGGTAIYLAKQHAAKVTAVNIVDVQLESAKRHLQNASKKARRALDVTFLNRDYLNTGFEDTSFDKVCAIESVCYTANKAKFVQEAYRLLKPGGKLVVMDTFQVRVSSTPEEHAYHERLCKTYHSPFGLKDAFKGALEDAGFQEIVFHDKFRNFIKTAKLYSLMSATILPLTWVLQKLGVISPEIHRATAGMNAFGQLGKYGLYTYGAFVATKP